MSSATLAMNPAPDPASPPPDTPSDTPMSCGSEHLVQTHLRAVWRFARLLGCRPDEADDLTQETFVVALQKGVGDRDERETAAFLRHTVRHLWLRGNERRNRRARLLATAAETVFERVCGAGPNDNGDRRVEALRECVDGLEGRPRQIVRLFYGEGRSRQDVAQRLGLQENGVKTALQRARAALRDCVWRKLS